MNSPDGARRIVERFLAEAVTAGDSAAMDELVAEEDLKQGVGWIKEALPDHAVIPEKLLVAEDDHVVALIRASGTHLGPLRDVPFDGQSMSGFDPPRGPLW
jgi:predicted ester cyclase